MSTRQSSMSPFSSMSRALGNVTSLTSLKYRSGQFHSPVNPPGNKSSLFESCSEFLVVRMSMKAEMSIPLLFSPASNRT
ncbi:hypothetical protein EYF80_058042 [Liparis tanakae]|uniref:Uncharacterized protein n=1 Tax=Liparis tanakae TaxID=230148 RepID=A0A4Z2ET98_9TELE|nr:hypothetical protein EYF80_058042 [Liparis tanakae]